jgi:hypothetical protein
MGKDFIPKDFAEFDGFYKNYCRIVNARTANPAPEWTHIPPARVTDLTAGYVFWHTAWEAYRDDRTKVKRAAALASWKEGGALLRDFTGEFIRYSGAVSEEDRSRVLQADMKKRNGEEGKAGKTGTIIP